MKKHYFLLLAAGCLSCLSVNAQNRQDGPMSQRDNRHPKIKRTAVLPACQVLTRAAAEALPDSTVWVDPEDGEKYWKEVYSYAEEGGYAKVEELEWDSDLSEWKPFSNSTYTYTEQGLLSSYKYTDVEGYEDERNFEYDGKKGTFTTTKIAPDYPEIKFKGDLTYNDQWLCLTETSYIAPDVNGDGKIDAGDYNADGTPWYKDYDASYEYDALGNCTKEVVTNFNDKASVSSKVVTTTVWDGMSYTEKVVLEYPGEGETETAERKYDVKEGNPQEGLWYEKDEDTGEWVLKDKDYTYFPKGSGTANETVEAPAEDVKVAAADGKIFISTPENMRVEVYSFVGKCCYNAVVNGNASVSGLPAGTYVVRADGKAMKVCVR